MVLHSACAPVGVGGTGKEGPTDEICKSRKITVPVKLWRVILILPGEVVVRIRARKRKKGGDD
jgi:hypothetical protein